MIKYFILLTIIIFSINIFALNQIELEAYYDSLDNLINKKIEKINIVQKGEILTRLINFSFTTYTEDFIDSVISTTHFISKTNDTLTTVYKLIKRNQNLDISTDFIDRDINRLKLENYNIYAGHNFKVFLSKICEIDKTKNGYIVRNIEKTLFIDSILLDKNKLPVYLNYHAMQGTYTIEIKNYRHYYGFLHIPDSLVVREGDTLVMKMNITDIEIIRK